MANESPSAGVPATASGLQLGITLRNMGDQSTPALMGRCAELAEEGGLSSLWVVDHIAIPPDDAEGSNGRYLDPLGSLAWLAGRTQRIDLGVGVLILPYRPPLPTAKLIATVQELSGERLILGAGIGWMQSEFAALGIERRHRGRDADRMLAFLHECFGSELAPSASQTHSGIDPVIDDVVVSEGQPFLFRPRPARPPILIGGGPPHALERAVKFGDGWLPMGLAPHKLAPKVAMLQELAAAAGRPRMQVTVFTGLPLTDAAATQDMLAAYAEAGADRIVHGARYDTELQYGESVAALALQLS